MSDTGYCECGCGQETALSPKTSAARGVRKGQPLRFLLGHQMRMPAARESNSQAQRLIQLRGPENPGWKGSAISYRSLHRWVERNKARTGSCYACGESGETQWASLTHAYERDLDEFVELCAICHSEYDSLLGFRAKPDGFRGGSRPARVPTSV